MPEADTECERNSAAYGRLKEAISWTYPRSWFVGIAGERVVGAAADFRVLESLLHTQGKDPRRVLVVQVGVDYPEYVSIFRFGFPGDENRHVNSTATLFGV